MKRYLFLIVLFLSVFCLLSQAYTDDYHIKPGDTLGITVLGEQDLTKHAAVDPKGNISMPLINEVRVSDLTLSQAAQTITKQLQRFLKNPQVSVELVESAKLEVTISGEVKNPGVFAVPNGAHIMDVITMAGSYMPGADLSKVSVTHPGNPAVIVDLTPFLTSGDASKNIPVSSGDTIFIPARDTEVIGIVTVLGAVREPGQHQIVKGMTVREAIMLAGGPTDVADLTKVTLRHAGSADAIPVDYVAASAGLPNSNPELKPGDVVYVAPSAVTGHYTIYGAVGSPGKFDLKAGTTITEAIAMAGGAKDRAKLNDVRILRNANGVTQTLQANVTNIMNGKAANIQIQDQDSIYVPQRNDNINYAQFLSIGMSLAWLIFGR